eukprot:CAMPEP_0177666646 /NCGR_PEP_ID=MMETSP0447-20121125/21695_1 /TAXON_ID=0 /ORGANISM="Stygamoeba regulata, Strain BSH-02190019" /LENGTH=98 /DNA_ID=CAMNT_0019172813 /DNA_START=426 /DNA_END=722 /DNA_ORIENTATION=+
MGDHTECVRVEFDPALVTYTDLLALFWKSHVPSHPSCTQYRSIIITTTPEQKAASSVEAWSAKRSQTMHTAVVALEDTSYTRAEEYHQKWVLKSRGKG